MSYFTVSFNGTTFQIPNPNDPGNWATAINQFFQALAADAAAVNATNTFTVPQQFNQTMPVAQQSGIAQLFAASDGFLYTVPGLGNSSAPIKIGGGGSSAPPFAAKTADYPITALDNQTRFSNVGAVGLVTLTLPTPGVGLEYYFACTAAEALTVSGGTFHGPSGMTGTAVTVYGALSGNRYTTFKLTCYDGATWVVGELTGSVVVS